jgi:hypothetical protein
MPYIELVHAVIETPAYLADADEAGMTEEERFAAGDIVAADPLAGDVMRGTGGCRKIRVAGKGKGKSGGYRIVTFFTGPDLPVFLLTVFGKGERANLSSAERNALAKLTKRLVEDYRKKVVPLRRRT